jgi:four helix bundle protein
VSLPHHKLVAWQRADDFYIRIHRVTHERLPRVERFELSAQIRRAAYSVPANFVEGNSRDSDRDRLRFFNFASSSLAEAGYGLHAAHRLGYLDDSVYTDLEGQLKSVSAPLHGLIRSKRKKLALKAAINGIAGVTCLFQLLRWIA